MNKHLGLDPDTRDFYRAGLEMGERGGLGLGQVLLAPSHRPVNCSVVHLVNWLTSIGSTQRYNSPVACSPWLLYFYVLATRPFRAVFPIEARLTRTLEGVGKASAPILTIPTKESCVENFYILLLDN